tara:strand:+ start:2775 stop:3029 length:255 start_codon:yes stop_codon:yes gene_type:complete
MSWEDELKKDEIKKSDMDSFTDMQGTGDPTMELVALIGLAATFGITVALQEMDFKAGIEGVKKKIKSAVEKAKARLKPKKGKIL